MPCYQQNTSTYAGLDRRTPAGFATEADCLQACKEGACCESNGTCNVRPQCQCQGAGQTFRGVGTVCTPNPCISCNDCCKLSCTESAASPPQLCSNLYAKIKMSCSSPGNIGLREEWTYIFNPVREVRRETSAILAGFSAVSLKTFSSCGFGVASCRMTAGVDFSQDDFIGNLFVDACVSIALSPDASQSSCTAVINAYHKTYVTLTCCGFPAGGGSSSGCFGATTYPLGSASTGMTCANNLVGLSLTLPLTDITGAFVCDVSRVGGLPSGVTQRRLPFTLPYASIVYEIEEVGVMALP